MTRNLVVATDRDSDAPLASACDLATRLGTPLVVMHVVSEEEFARLREDAPEESGYLDVMIAEIRDELTVRTTELLAGRDVGVVIVVTHGEVVPEIQRVADDYDAEMLFIGVRNRSRVGKLLFGSTAQALLLDTPRPIVAVPV